MLLKQVSCSFRLDGGNEITPVCKWSYSPQDALRFLKISGAETLRFRSNFDGIRLPKSNSLTVLYVLGGNKFVTLVLQ